MPYDDNDDGLMFGNPDSVDYPEDDYDDYEDYDDYYYDDYEDYYGGEDY